MPQKGGTPERLLRWVPAVILPTMVGMLQSQSGLAALPILIVATILGIIVAAAVPHVRLAASIAMLLGCFLLTAENLSSLQISESDTLHVRPAPVRLPTAASPDALPVAAAPGKPSMALARAQDSQPVAERAPVVLPAAASPARFLPAKQKEAAEAWPEPTPLETISVVLPCAFEGSFATQTVESIYAHTDKSRLLEIIVVDDGSTPPLSTVIPERVFKTTPARIIRNEKTVGLIGAKYIGGNSAKGDVIVFLDCHVKPRDGWDFHLLSTMKRAGDHRTVAVPVITTLNIDSWTEVGGNGGAKACYLMLNADFSWLSDPGRDVPMMSGGLLGISRRWWHETGGLDDEMVAWGGENIDQSLRAWLCGGRIEVAEGSFVAHMWRDANNPKTALKYPIPTEQVMRNKARAVFAWFGEFHKKTFRFPEYENFVANHKNIGDMSNFDRLKEQQKCVPFSHYIHRFDYVYIKSGMIPQTVYQLREEKSGLCLERVQRRTAPHGLMLAQCSVGQERGEATELQLWHGGNRDRSRPGGPCCSGIMAGNLVQCLSSWGQGQKVETSECNIDGLNEGQFFKEDSSGQIAWKNGEGCLTSHRHVEPEQISEGACGFRVEAVGSWKVEGMPEVPAAFILKAAASPGAENQCLTVGGEDSTVLQLRACEQSVAQTFGARPTPSGNGVQVTGFAGNCLDAGAGHPLLYVCDSEGKNNNQIWQIDDNQLMWSDPASGENCLDRDQPVSFKALKRSKHVVFMTCAPKKGQRFQKHDVREAQGTFLLKDMDSGQCLGTLGGGGALGLMGCSDQQRWRELKSREQVQHVATSWCLDAGDEATPIAYPCHEPKAQRKQRFEIAGGGVRTKPGWEDNGRVRFFERCLDHSPKPGDEIFIEDCGTTKAEGIRWTRIGEYEPEEWTLWKNSAKPLPGALPLGGSAAPP